MSIITILAKAMSILHKPSSPWLGVVPATIAHIAQVMKTTAHTSMSIIQQPCRPFSDRSHVGNQCLVVPQLSNSYEPSSFLFFNNLVLTHLISGMFLVTVIQGACRSKSVTLTRLRDYWLCSEAIKTAGGTTLGIGSERRSFTHIHLKDTGTKTAILIVVGKERLDNGHAFDK